MLVEGLRILVFSIGDDGDGGDLTRGGERTSQGVQKQSPTEPPTLVLPVYRQPADQGRRIYPVPCDAVRKRGWEVAPLDGYRAQRVVAGEPILLAVVEDPDRGDPLLHLPTRPLTQVPVQGPLAAGENRPESQVLLSERLESVALIQRSALQDYPRLPRQGTQALVRLRRLDERLDEDAATFGS